MSEALQKMDFRKVFIVGSGRSGTTWAQKLFLDHPGVVGPAMESKVFLLASPFIQGQRKFREHWKEILARYDAYPKGTRLQILISRNDLVCLIHSLRSQKISDKEMGRKLADGIFRNYFMRHGGNSSRTFVEKTPRHLFHVREILEMYPDAKIICMIRDGRDVCVSLQRAHEKGISWCPRERRQQILFWKEAAERWLDYLADGGLRGSLLTVRYEDLKASPEAGIRRMFEFAGLDAPSDLLKKMIQKHDVSLLIGKTPAVHTGAVGQWKEAFSEEDHKLFRALCGDLPARMGYAQNGTASIE